MEIKGKLRMAPILDALHFCGLYGAPTTGWLVVLSPVKPNQVQVSAQGIPPTPVLTELQLNAAAMGTGQCRLGRASKGGGLTIHPQSRDTFPWSPASLLSLSLRGGLLGAAAAGGGVTLHGADDKILCCRASRKNFEYRLFSQV